MDWRTWTFTGCKHTPIENLLAEGTHKLEAWGNSKEGWAPYLVSNGSGIQVGPMFIPEMGDRLKDLKAAAGRVYGIDPNEVKRGRNFP